MNTFEKAAYVFFSLAGIAAIAIGLYMLLKH